MAMVVVVVVVVVKEPQFALFSKIVAPQPP